MTGIHRGVWAGNACKSGTKAAGDSSRFGLWLVLFTMLAVLIAPTSSRAQTEGLGGQTMQVALDRSASRAMLHLQEGWIQWMSLFFQDRAEEADRQVDELLASLESLGMKRLPELSMGAVVRGVEAAHQGNYARAEVAFGAAEKLDPGRPETAFGRAILAEERGQSGNALKLRYQGFIRLLRTGSYGSLWSKNLIQAVLTAAMLAGGAFVLLLMIQFGGGLFDALSRSLSRPLPVGLNRLAAGALLLWPILLPAGLAWLLLYWSILIWRYSSISQRLVLVMLWLVAGTAPVLLHFQEQQVELQLSPPGRSLAALEEGRLYGGLFSDLGVLGSLLPTSPAVQQVFGDVHRRLGQWERARDRYGWIIDREPTNVAALVGVGNFYFRKEDYGHAIENYNEAIGADVTNAAAHFNLSQAYSESYLFEDHRRALEAARTADERLVGAWIQEGHIDRVISIDGGIERRSEILRELDERFAGDGIGATSPFRPMALPLVALVLALAFLRLGPDEVSSGSSDGSNPLVRALVPGLSSTEQGRGILGYSSLFAVASLLQLLMIGRIGYELPWGLDPGSKLTTLLGLVGLLLFASFRGWRALRMGNR